MAIDYNERSSSCKGDKRMGQSGREVSRRSFLKRSTVAGASASTFMIIKPELVRGAGNEKLKVGLVGCGGRGTQAAQQLLHGNENVELVAMGDIFEDRLENLRVPKSGGGRLMPPSWFLRFGTGQAGRG
jgi:hypothetical protein